MNTILKLSAVAIILTLPFSCKNSGEAKSDEANIQLVDKKATIETRYLFNNLLKYQDSAIMFGHQDDLAYGIGWWGGEFNSDVAKVTGKYPAVFGWDLGEIGEERNIDSVLFDDIEKWIIEVYKRGGINSISLHLDNPVTGGDSWDVTPAVSEIIPGGSLHKQFKVTLDVIAAFFSRLKADDGTFVPVIFRPWHELNGSWFWWGRDLCTPEEFKELFRFTVEYLRDEKSLHHILYSYSTDRFSSEQEYLERYPGDDYVDILGYDDYHSFTQKETINQGIQAMQILAGLSEQKEKPFALTETGLETIPEKDWWTEHLLYPILEDPDARKISYLLVWRNGRLDHHYAPYPGHISEASFKLFEDNPATWFLEDLPDFYR